MVQIYNLFSNDKMRQDYFLNYFTIYNLCKIIKTTKKPYKTLSSLIIKRLFVQYLSFTVFVGIAFFLIKKRNKRNLLRNLFLSFFMHYFAT